jgi:formylglycine-generating enzyme required for sulfatase activity
VTRAQYAGFDKQYAVPPGQENHPANAISFEQAKSYCEWLSKQTGQMYRLAGESEVQSLYESAPSEENTLDYWAGYKVNPDDAERLANELKKMDGSAPLLKPAGSFMPLSSDALIFDLGGNVAEWTIAEDGSGRRLGGSADTPVDVKRRRATAAPQYTGFRVIKGASPNTKQ